MGSRNWGADNQGNKYLQCLEIFKCQLSWEREILLASVGRSQDTVKHPIVHRRTAFQELSNLKYKIEPLMRNPGLTAINNIYPVNKQTYKCRILFQ